MEKVIVTDADIDQYLETILWAENDQSDERGGAPLDRNYGVWDFSDEARDQAHIDLSNFRRDMGHALNAIGDEADELNLDEWPRDFWLSRNGHGTGFFDREELYGELADVLQVLAKLQGEAYVYVGDDRQVHFG